MERMQVRRWNGCRSGEGESRIAKKKKDGGRDEGGGSGIEETLVSW